MQRVGLVGVGRMGSRLAGRLLDAGLELTVFDTDASKTAALASKARVASVAAETAADADAVITMVTDGPALLAALSGDQGVLAGARPGLLLIDMSTIGLDDSRRVAQACDAAQVRYVRSPVLGTLPSAAAGQLTALVSGPPEAVAAARPLLAHLCAQQHELGPAEHGRAAKLIINGLLASALASFAEGLALGERAGLDRDQLLEVIAGSSMASPAIKGSAEAVRQRQFDPRLTVALLVKDLRLLVEAGAAVGAALPLAGTALPLYQAAANLGWAEQDTAAIVLLLEALSGTAPAPRTPRSEAPAG